MDNLKERPTATSNAPDYKGRELIMKYIKFDADAPESYVKLLSLFHDIKDTTVYADKVDMNSSLFNRFLKVISSQESAITAHPNNYGAAELTKLDKVVSERKADYRTARSLLTHLR